MRTGKDCFGATRRLRAALLTSSALALAWSLPAAPAHAQDATWLAAPGSNDYGTGANWSTGTVPTGTALFGASNITGLSLVTNDEANRTDVGGWTFNAGAGNYTFANGQSLNFNGAGIVINGGSATITVLDPGGINFLNASTAGGAIITNNNTGGAVNFYNTSTAGTATITSYGGVNFYNASTAGSAHITINYNGDDGGQLSFLDTSTAGSATITNNMHLYFNDTSTAGSAAITNNGVVVFSGASTAGNATITNNTSSLLGFNGTSTAGNAAITNNAGGIVDFSGSTGPAGDGKLSAGSIAGAGSFFLGARELTVGGNNLSTEVSGVISDCGTSPTCSAAGATGGSLVKTGTGTLTLSGTNTYTGGTTINGGTLQIGNGGTSGSVTGNITDNAALIFNRSDTVNYGGVISGSGTLEKLGAGTLILESANTYTGATTISAGTLTILDSVASRAITNNATLVYSSTSTAGSATITNNQQLLFTASSTAGNATITNNNQLAFDTNATAGSALIINVGHTLFDGNSTAGSAQLSNASAGSVFDLSMTTGPNGDNKLTAGSLLGGGTFYLGANQLTAGSDNLSTNVTGVLADGGSGGGAGASLVKVGTGTLTLAGINTYTGATMVDGGALVVNGSIAASSGVTVNNGGTLGGGGTVGATTVNAGGTLVAGNGTASSSLKVAGSVALQSGAFYMVQINPATSSFANVTGTATLGGSTLKAVYANGSYVVKQYTILTAGSVSGTFGSVVQTNLPSNFRTTLSYDGTHAYLNLILGFVPPPGGGPSGNQQNVGNSIINSFNANGGISLVYSGLTAAGLTQASGETAAGSQQSTFQAMGQFMGLLTDPFSTGRETDAFAPSAYADSAPAGAARDAFAMLAKAPPAETFEQRWSVWASGFGGSQTTDGNIAQGSNSATSRLFGTAAGAEYAFSPQTLAGFALAGGGTSFSVAGGGFGRSDLFQAGAYVRHNNGPGYITAALAYGWQDVATDRTVTLAGVDRLRAEFNANAWSGRVEGGYRFVAPWIGGIGVTPYAAGQFTTFDLPAYAETVVSGSNAFALAYAARSVTDTRSELGLRTDKSFAMQNGVLTLRGRAAWAHDFNPDRSVAATFQALPGASFVVNGARAAADAALTTASAEMKWLNGWSTAASFESELSNVTRSYAGKGALRYAW